MGLLDGKVAILSGVGEGLGRDAALIFAREGADLVLAARSDAVIGKVAAEVEGQGRKALAITADIENLEDCRNLVTQSIARFARIDVLVNIAYRSEGHAGAIGKVDDRVGILQSEPDLSNWRPQFDLNVFGTMQITKAVVDHMVQRRSGSIIMVNSMASRLGVGLAPSYSASKAALESLTRSLAQELGPHGIRVNGMHPGYMWGPQIEFIMRHRAEQGGISVDEEVDRVTQAIPLGYIPPTREYADTLLYLASDLSRPVTGQGIHVNGGQYCP